MHMYICSYCCRRAKAIKITTEVYIRTPMYACQRFRIRHEYVLTVRPHVVEGSILGCKLSGNYRRASNIYTTQSKFLACGHSRSPRPRTAIGWGASKSTGIIVRSNFGLIGKRVTSALFSEGKREIYSFHAPQPLRPSAYPLGALDADPAAPPPLAWRSCMARMRVSTESARTSLVT